MTFGSVDGFWLPNVTVLRKDTLLVVVIPNVTLVTETAPQTDCRTEVTPGLIEALPGALCPTVAERLVSATPFLWKDNKTFNKSFKS